MYPLLSVRSSIIAAAASLMLLPLHADIVSLFPDADTTLIEYFPSNSMGAAPWFNSGTTQNGPRNRALLRFNIAGNIPPGSKIVAVQLRLSVNRVPAEPPPESLFSLRRMLRPWGEGTNREDEMNPGWGSLADTGAATWSHRFYGTTNTWAAPGGLEGVDYSPAFSTAALINEIGRYSFEETLEAASDVQFWLDHPEANFGWMLKTESEESRFTARRFGSRELEDPLESPRLLIDYIPPPHVMNARIVQNQMQFTFAVFPGISYAVEFTQGFPSTNWVTLTNLPTIFFPTNAGILDVVTTPGRFYRVRTHF